MLNKNFKMIYTVYGKPSSQKARFIMLLSLWDGAVVKVIVIITGWINYVKD